MARGPRHACTHAHTPDGQKKLVSYLPIFLQLHVSPSGIWYSRPPPTFLLFHTSENRAREGERKKNGKKNTLERGERYGRGFVGDSGHGPRSQPRAGGIHSTSTTSRRRHSPGGLGWSATQLSDARVRGPRVTRARPVCCTRRAAPDGGGRIWPRA